MSGFYKRWYALRLSASQDRRFASVRALGAGLVTRAPRLSPASRAQVTQTVFAAITSLRHSLPHSVHNLLQPLLHGIRGHNLLTSCGKHRVENAHDDGVIQDTHERIRVGGNALHGCQYSRLAP